MGKCVPYKDIVALLLEKTNEDKIKWKKDYLNVYHVYVNDYIVYITKDKDEIVFSINTKGKFFKCGDIIYSTSAVDEFTLKLFDAVYKKVNDLTYVFLKIKYDLRNK